MPNKIIFIRHGQTNHNLKKLVQGWPDTKLNKSGIKQASRVADRLKDEIIDKIYSSDLSRALNTANAIAKKGKFSIQSDKRIREWNMGSWANKHWEDIHKNFQHILDKQGSIIDYDWKDHGGESINDMRERLKDFLAHLKKNHSDQTIVIVTHGGTKRIMLKMLNLISEHERPSMDNAAITAIEKDKNGKYKLTLFNDSSHLKEQC